MDTLNQSNKVMQQELQLVKQFEKHMPGIEKLYQQLSEHREKIAQWASQKENSQQLFESDPNGCLKEILGADYATIENTFQEQPLMEQMVSASPEYVPASINYTNGWDVVFANAVPVINKAFEAAYKRFCIEKNGSQRIVTFFKDIKSEETGLTSHLEVSMAIPTLSITGVVGSMILFESGKTDISINIQKGDSSEAVKTTLENCGIALKINVSNAIVTTEKGERVFDVFIGIAEDDCQDNKLTAPEVEISADCPSNIGKIFWKSMLNVIGQGIQRLIVNMDEGEKYRICSVNLSSQADEIMQKYNWLIPNTARFNTQKDVLGDQLENYAMIIFLMTAHPAHKGLNLDVPSNSIQGENTGTVAISGPVILKDVILATINKMFQSECNVAEAFTYVEENARSHAYLEIEDGKSANVTLHLEDLPLFGDEDICINLKKTKIQLIDGGIYLAGEFNTSIKDLLKISGTFKLNLAINGVEKDGSFVINVSSPSYELDPKVTYDWGMWLIVIAISFIIPGLPAIIVNIIIVVLKEELEKMLNLDGSSLQTSFAVSELVNWNGINFAKLNSLDISYGAKLGYHLVVSE